MYISYYQQNKSSLKQNFMSNTLTGDSIFSTKETKYLDEVGKWKEWFDQVLKKITKQRQSSLMKINKEKDERIKRIRSISNQVNFNNKLQTSSFKFSSRNKTSLLSSKDGKKKNQKLIVVSHKMVTHRTQKSKGKNKLGEKYHSVDSGIKVSFRCFFQF